MDFKSISTPQKTDLLVSFMDIQGFLGIAQATPDLLRLFELLNGWAAILIEEIEQARGRVIKFIGDSCLAVFSEDEADGGVRALLAAKGKAEEYFKRNGFPNKMRVTAHFGEAVIGEFGAGSRKGLDVFGDSVNVAASLERADRRARMTISPQAFRKLAPATRALFHKHTPPIVYTAED